MIVGDRGGGTPLERQKMEEEVRHASDDNRVEEAFFIGWWSDSAIEWLCDFCSGGGSRHNPDGVIR